MPASASHWDIFCAVVDNYGDVGFAWRLARQLGGEHGIGVRLFVDNLAALACLVPEVDAASGTQTVRGVDVRRWDHQRADPAAVPGDVVIEAFGCGLPASYLAAMVERKRQPVWINLEYLSAETWIERCHGLASRHATLPLTRYFFFPGFTAASGGLLRERDLCARRDQFRSDQRAREGFWRALGLAAPAEDTLVVSLFCYPNATPAALLDAWADGGQPLLCLVPEGVAADTLVHWSGGNALRAGQRFGRGRLTLAGVPFVSQDDYDRLLWTCDINFVRGEDSFVRAQWAARPLIWHVYPQTENAHRLKLEAFLVRYCAGLAADAATAVRSLLRAWNCAGDAGVTWPAFAAARGTLDAHAVHWAEACAAQPDLASALVKFCIDQV
jgi:uncharacterized repeat protein (TIGR03837 family)